MLPRRKTVVHVTHQTTEKTGRIGTVLEGLFTSSSYLASVERSIIIGPLFDSSEPGQKQLGPDGGVLYSSVDAITNHPYAYEFEQVERKFGVSIVYGNRHFCDPEGGVQSQVEVVLIDVTRADINPVNALKGWMYAEFGIESRRYEDDWQYDQYVMLAPAALAVLRAIGVSEPADPAILIAHEYRGMPTILAAIMDPLVAFKTIFYAHEVSTARSIIQGHPGHDTMFYNTMNRALTGDCYLSEIFGPQDSFFQHELLSAARHCDNIIATGDYVFDELRFLSPRFSYAPIDLCYKGVKSLPISLAQKQLSKTKLQQYAENLLGYRPDYVFTHVCRFSISKGIWRDLRVLEHLEDYFRRASLSGIFFILSTDMPPRTSDDIYRMEQLWSWPLAHRQGRHDLSDAEADFYTAVQIFNARARNIKVVMVNQFGWDSLSCGRAMPADMEFSDIRKGSDLEFGQSIYEPFGSSQMEPLTFGGLCVISSICGCKGFLESLSNSHLPANVIIADYTRINDKFAMADQQALLAIDFQQRNQVEHHVSDQVARTIFDRLPQNERQTEALIKQGYDLARQMSWNTVCEKYLLPALDRAYLKARTRQIA